MTQHTKQNNEIREAERELERLINNPLKNFFDAMNYSPEGEQYDSKTSEGTTS